MDADTVIVPNAPRYRAGSTAGSPAAWPRIRTWTWAASGTGLVICILSTLATAIALRDFTYPDGWVSAHEAVMAMQFAAHGVLALGGVPIQNMGSLTASPDAYLNWPPLYPIVLSWVIRLAGHGETLCHLTAASLTFATAVLLFAIVRRECSTLAAAIGTLAFLAAPVVALYGQAGLHVHLAILATIAGLACLGRAIPDAGPLRMPWVAACAACFAAAAFTSWEPCLVAPGVACVALLRHDKRGFRLGILIGVVTTAAALGVFALYWLSYPDAILAVLHRALLRTGIGSDATAAILPPHAVSDSLEPAGIPSRYPLILMQRLGTVGVLGVGGLCAMLVLARRILRPRPGLAYAIGGLASMGVLWSAGMANHMAIHSYEVLIVVPLAALAAACVWHYAAEQRLFRALQWVPLLIAIALANREIVMMQLLRFNASEAPLIRFGRVVLAATEPDAIVAVPARDMVFVYYGRRQTVRGIIDQRMLDEERPGILGLCSTCPVYMAIPVDDASRFPALASQPPARTFVGLGSLYRLRSAAP